MDLVGAHAYYPELTEAMDRAKKRILIHAMNISWNGSLAPIADVLHQALDRGVDVTLVGDIYSKFDDTIDRLSGNRAIHKGWRHTQRVNKGLQAAGARIDYLGTLGLNPFRHRCHSKVTIVDDTVYTFGGINFFDKAKQWHDYMLRVAANASFADSMESLVSDIVGGRLLDHDMTTELDAHNKMIFDIGVPGMSAIYSAACDLVQGARKVWLVTQYPPSGKLCKALDATNATCYFNRLQPQFASFPTNLAIAIDTFRHPTKNHYRKQQYLHAKFILAEMQDGSKQLLSGSHNFSYRGVRYGTKEIALLSSDEHLWQQLYGFLQHEIA